MLTADRVRELFRYDPNTGSLIWRASRSGTRAGQAGTITKYGYRRVTIDGRPHLAHRVIWLWMTGEQPPAQIDHDNRNGLDNRWLNLKPSTQVGNQRNRSLFKTNKSGTPGVLRPRGATKWVARIKSNGRYVHLGSFESKDDAVAARKIAEVVFDYHPNHGSLANSG